MLGRKSRSSWAVLSDFVQPSGGQRALSLSTGCFSVSVRTENDINPVKTDTKTNQIRRLVFLTKKSVRIHNQETVKKTEFDHLEGEGVALLAWQCLEAMLVN
jgi:hypothetical protein